MKKAVFSTIVAFAGLSACAVQVDCNNLRWSFELDNGGAVLTHVGNRKNGASPEGPLVIPEILREDNNPTSAEYVVTGICMLRAPEMTELTIPATVTRLDAGAFKECARLWKVVFEGKNGDDIDYASVFEGTSFLETIKSYDNRTPETATWQYTTSKDRYGYIQDNNQYDENWQHWVQAGEVGQKWFVYKAPAKGYMTLNVWKSDCDVDIAVYKGEADGTLAPQASPMATASVKHGYLQFLAKKGVTYYIGVDGWKNKSRRARGTYELNWHFGSELATVKLNLNGGSLPVGVKQFEVPKGLPVGNLPTPVREGYDFGGWYQDSALTKAVKMSSKANGNVTAHAKWTEKKLLLTVKGDKAKGKYSGMRGRPTDLKYKGKKVFLKSASGAKAHFKVGSTVTLVAKPKKDYAFSQWIVNGDFAGEFFSKKRYRRSRIAPIRMPTSNTVARPYYIELAKDYVEMFGPDTWYFDEGKSTITIRTASATECDVTATGSKELMQNLTFKKQYSGDTLYVKITANKKILAEPGVWKIKLTATSSGGKTAKKTIAVFGKNKTQAIDNGHLKGLDTRTLGTPYTNFYVGIWGPGLGIAPKGSTWRIVSVTGVPGLSWSHDDGYWCYRGVPTKAGTFLATVTVERPASQTKKNGKTVYVTQKLETATALIVVNPFPEKYVGTYYGYTQEPFIRYNEEWQKNETIYRFGAGSRKVKVTISSSGKVTADVAGAKFSGNLENFDNDPSFRTLYFFGTISGNGTGKNKNKKTWQDDLIFRLSMDFIEDPDNGFGFRIFPLNSGTNIRWRLEGDKKLEASFGAQRNILWENELNPGKNAKVLDAILSAMKWDFSKSPSDVGRETRLAFDRKMDPDPEMGANSPFTHLKTNVNDDVPVGDVVVRHTESSTDGVVKLKGVVKDYKGKEYDMSGSAVLEVYRAESNEEVPYLEDDDPKNRYVVTARFFKRDENDHYHVLQVLWYIGQREEFDEGMDPDDPTYMFRVKGAEGYFWK